MGEIVKVTRNYQVTIPATVRAKANIREGDLVEVLYDEDEGVIKIIPVRRKRLTIRLGRRITVEEIEEAIEEALDEATSP
ncbi:AbrB/MazE/SpoVT family DNA-binding domain-containing protein [Hyperthermus butylicus]|uniref:Conserved crenarchaeal protein n=1 Tax=Hyperthermus butylicus (strain DSM 5456 / JCM 9403 / PLM1-5) TaxID=415426 RepID=A2BMH6_HYPBU|nr:AbrB/MazE/SpoVT family DNA-binding domain-containing protein [Hyperthermus butylicus]ABM81187.1 conserved crenarchaeal protein [Hyperthermus butylicus DSM 5456]